MRDTWLPEHGLSLDAGRPLITIFYDDPMVVPSGQRKYDICLPIRAHDNSADGRSAA